jgi:hypothetical protein
MSATPNAITIALVDARLPPPLCFLHTPMSDPPAPEKEAPPLRCPACGCELIDRRARRGLRDYCHFFFGRYPFRCRLCGLEFYLPHRGTQDRNS